eukprot:757982-Hanusia_phi.AAC.3
MLYFISRFPLFTSLSESPPPLSLATSTYRTTSWPGPPHPPYPLCTVLSARRIFLPRPDGSREAFGHGGARRVREVEGMHGGGPAVPHGRRLGIEQA